MILRLARLESNKDAVRGVLYVDGRIRFATLEDPWNENKIAASCVPTGRYICKRVQSPKFGNTFEVTGVPGRSKILFHAGNTSDDTTGCILLGLGFTDRADRLEVHSSRMAMKRFLLRLESLNSFILDIVDLCFSAEPLQGPKIL
jgi:hypothetical protein